MSKLGTFTSHARTFRLLAFSARRSTGIAFCPFDQFRCPFPRTNLRRDRLHCSSQSPREASKRLFSGRLQRTTGRYPSAQMLQQPPRDKSDRHSRSATMLPAATAHLRFRVKARRSGANLPLFRRLHTLQLSCSSFHPSRPLFSMLCALFDKNTGGGIPLAFPAPAPKRKNALL
jgi:hypothetical protein